MRHGKPVHIKRILLGIIIITTCVVGYVFSVYRNRAEPPMEETNSVEEQANISIRNFQQSSIKDGIKQWSMEADSAQYQTTEKKAVIQAPSVTFYLNKDENIYLTARQGVLKTDTNDIQVSGNVSIKSQEYKLFSETMEYRNKTRQFSSTSPVRIIGMHYRLAADSMWLNLDSDMAGFSGNVKGFFGEDLSL